MAGAWLAPTRLARTMSLRLTMRGVVALAGVVTLGLAEILSARTGLLPLVLVIGLPLIAAPVVVLERGRRAATAQVRTMVSPPLVAVGGDCELIVQLANEGSATLPPLSLERPEDHAHLASRPSRPPLSASSGSPTPWWRGHRFVAADPGRVIRWKPLNGGQSSSSALALPTWRRGVFTIGPLRLWVHDPFGLVGLPLGSATAVRLVVHPQCAALTGPPSRPGVSSHATFTSARQSPHDAPRDDPGGELSGLRPYVPGDRLHLLSWSVEARYGTLMVHEFRPDGDALISIVLDDRAGVHRQAAFERALSMAYALVAEAVRHSFDTYLTTISGDRIVVAPTREGMVELLSFLARAEPRRATRLTPTTGTPPFLGAASTVLTTPTAHASLPDLQGDLRVVVVE